MMEPKDRPAVRHEALLALVVERQRPIAEWRANHEAWRAEIEPRQGGGTRQAAPWSGAPG